MADEQNDRIVYPDEVEDAKAKPAEGEKKKFTEPEESEEVAQVTVEKRNMIVAPSNCPPGKKMGADGVCRDVFD